MGNPANYSLELPARCLRLLDGLREPSTHIFSDDRPDLGPLTATLLLSLSIPIFSFPIERLDRPSNDESKDYLNDRSLNPGAAKKFTSVINNKLSKAPFYKSTSWRFAEVDPPFDLSKGLPTDFANMLAAEDSIIAARNLDCRLWASVLRNALAHAGVAYLDEYGQSRYGAPVAMYAFVSGKFDDTDTKVRVLRKIRALRISESDYREFLKGWVSWLRDIGAYQLAA